MLLVNKQVNTDYYIELYSHSYIDDCLYGMVKNKDKTVLTVSFNLHYYKLIVEICKGQDRRLLMRNYQNKSIKDLCKLRIKNKKPIRIINYT